MSRAGRSSSSAGTSTARVVGFRPAGSGILAADGHACRAVEHRSRHGLRAGGRPVPRMARFAGPPARFDRHGQRTVPGGRRARHTVSPDARRSRRDTSPARGRGECRPGATGPLAGPDAGARRDWGAGGRLSAVLGGADLAGGHAGDCRGPEWLDGIRPRPRRVHPGRADDRNSRQDVPRSRSRRSSARSRRLDADVLRAQRAHARRRAAAPPLGPNSARCHGARTATR